MPRHLNFNLKGVGVAQGLIGSGVAWRRIRLTQSHPRDVERLGIVGGANRLVMPRLPARRPPFTAVLVGAIPDLNPHLSAWGRRRYVRSEYLHSHLAVH